MPVSEPLLRSRSFVLCFAKGLRHCPLPARTVSSPVRLFQQFQFAQMSGESTFETPLARAVSMGSPVPERRPRRLSFEGTKEGRVLSIQSHTVHGYVGNKSAVFPLQLLGLDVDPVNSVQFSNHTGYANGVRGQILQGSELSALREGLMTSGIMEEVPYTHLLTGYIGSLSFLESVLQMLSALRSENPNLTYVCDPVLGDHGKLYVPEALVDCYRNDVIPLATVLTPNQFECELLTGIRIHSREDAMRAADALHEKGVRTVVITSIEYGKDGSSTSSVDVPSKTDAVEDHGENAPTDGDGDLYVEGGTLLTVFASHISSGVRPERYELNVPKLCGCFTGTGDLSAALLLAWLHRRPDDVAYAVEKSMCTLQAVLIRTVREGKGVGGAPPEIRLIQSKEDIERPPRMISSSVRALHAPIEGIVFDMDGTLTMPEQLDFKAMRGATRCPENVDIIEHVKAVAREHATEGERLEKIVSDVELKAFETLKLQPGMVEAMKNWQQNGRVRLGLSTRNCAEATQVFLDKSGLGSEFFDPLMVRYSLPVEKPSPQILWHVSEGWDIHTSHILFVGDSLDDLRCARAAGCRFALVLSEGNKHLSEEEGVDVVVRNFSELVDYVEASSVSSFR